VTGIGIGLTYTELWETTVRSHLKFESLAILAFKSIFDFSAAMAESTTGRLTLANIPFDLKITICIFLRPFDILSLRMVCESSINTGSFGCSSRLSTYKKTCKAFELATRQRVVWLAVFHRVCLDNGLFLPSFPIPDMSDLELEQAAIAPHRWIELCGDFKKQHHPGDTGTILRPRTTRIIRDSDVPMSYLFLVPGGRYLVVAGDFGLFVWDLGYVSNAHCTLIASVELEGVSITCKVQATPDGMGLVILVFDILW
jgi:hypothetical protein